MSKSAVTRLFIGSVIAVIAAVVLMIVAVIAAYADGAFVIEGQEVVGINGSAFTWTMFGIALLAVLTMVGGAIGGLVAWIGALLNTSRLDDKTWFILLLVLGVMSFGFFAMIAYVIAGPDGMRAPVAKPEPISMNVGGVHA